MQLCISNPPYNLKWRHPDFAAFDPRFLVLPEERNANFAFVQTAIHEAERAILLLPNSVLKPQNSKADMECIKILHSQNLIDAVVNCPGEMFVSTSIAVCLLFLSKNKKTTTIEFIDMQDFCRTEIRKQNGQVVGNSNQKRVYEKKFNVFEAEHIDFILNCIEERKSEPGRCACATREEVIAKNYDLRPRIYIEAIEEDSKSRAYSDIVADLNRIRTQKNMCKLTINKTLARNLGLKQSLFETELVDAEFDEFVEKIAGEKIIKANYITFTDSAVLKFENTSKTEISPIIAMIFEAYKRHIYFLNNEENRYLAEMRDALIPDLISGKIEV